LGVNKGLRTTVFLTATVMNAVLYGVFSLATASITSPLLAGRFRPAVVVPAFFATVFGPLCGGTGAAIGTLIADSLTHGGDVFYGGSWLASMPGNFIGFFLFGYIVKKFSWKRFILASEVTLTVANGLVAFLYVFLFKVFYLNLPTYGGASLDAQMAFSLGLTLWWYVTMLPFVLLLTPLLIRATALAFPSFVPEEVRKNSLREEISKGSIGAAMMIPGVIMIVAALGITFVWLGANTTSIQIMLYISGAALTILGGIVYAKRMRPPSDESKPEKHVE
jgi:MFS family permease